MEIDDVYLDSIAMKLHIVGYGALGTSGSLGYEDKTVRVHGNSYAHAFGAHPPARLLFPLEGRFRGFRCSVALNDGVPFRGDPYAALHAPLHGNVQQLAFALID